MPTSSDQLRLLETIRIKFEKPLSGKLEAWLKIPEKERSDQIRNYITQSQQILKLMCNPPPSESHLSYERLRQIHDYVERICADAMIASNIPSAAGSPSDPSLQSSTRSSSDLNPYKSGAAQPGQTSSLPPNSSTSSLSSRPSASQASLVTYSGLNASLDKVLGSVLSMPPQRR